MKKLIILLAMFLINCRMVNTNSCPNIVNYTIDETREIEKIRVSVKNIILNRFLKDYLDLREKIRICKK
ncbi:MAG: hypothetical protein Ta2D_04610 [Rickettsiales bacterium]|nr:MAG: hypothetical protein Ta2D_04610 [Rickettsiales bacterium]